jgi:UDP-N-acetylglucosamine diphosphorylase/glucosamine-1-phosphate N-acetyltransferase
MNLVFFDGNRHKSLLPLTFTRPVAALRVGILTIEEKWKKYLVCENTSYLTQDYLSEKFKLKTDSINILINAAVCPNMEAVQLIKNLKLNEAIYCKEELIAICVDSNGLDTFNHGEVKVLKVYQLNEINILNSVPDIFLLNDIELRSDFNLVTKGRTSSPLSKTNTIIGDITQIFIEDDAICEASILNCKTGPIYIGKKAEIMEGTVIRGPLAACEYAQIKLSTKIYGATTIGPHCRVGGEINNSVLLAYSNKGHDGFLGNSIIGEWCNLGADTNNSNLKNNYGEVKIWDYEYRHLKNSGLQFCGLIMGDHSKSGINTMFNTGTTVGVCANIFGGGFPPTYIPSFSWGGAEGLEEFRLNKAFEVAERVMARRNCNFSIEDKKILEQVKALDGCIS